MVSIDNNSRFPVVLDTGNFRYVRWKRNRGVAAAWNRGVREARGEQVVFLNTDAFPHGDWMGALLANIDKTWEKKPIGALSPTMCEEWELERIRRNVGNLSTGLSGACFMMTKNVLADVGLFDERFTPAYYEDTDMWHRLKDKRYALANTAMVCMGHRFAQSSSQLKDLEGVKARNLKKYKEKWNEQ